LQPFRIESPVNPSWEIAKSLPPFLPPPKSSSSSGISLIARHPPVRILVHPEPVNVAYKTVRELVPRLWDIPRIDFMIHIGMATSRKFYSVERRGYRDGYEMRDVDGELLSDTEEGRQEWDGLPKELLTDINVDDVWQRWRAALSDADVRISEDAGRYLCDYIYYSTLAQLFRKGEERRVVFLHVPVESNDAAVKAGVEITIELIRALVQSSRMKNVLRQ
jgi:pyroglutamyl-peptidase